MATSFGFLSTHPPTQCGLATFNCSLAAQLTAGGIGGGIVRVLTDGDDRRAAPGVVHTWSAAHATGWLGAASALNQFDVAVIQHEYGIYPGPDGQDVLPLLRRLRVPSIVVLHSVLTNPSFRQRILLEQIGAMADAVITMTQAARDRLVAGYAVDPAQGDGHPARRSGVRHPADRGPHGAAPAHLGADRARQGHRVGVARAAAPARPRPAADLHRSPGAPTRRSSNATARPTAAGCSDWARSSASPRPSPSTRSTATPSR